MSTGRHGQPQSNQAGPTVLSVAFPYAPVGPDAVGGAEVVCSLVEAALPGMGFRSVVVAHADSRPTGRLYGTRIPFGLITDAVRAEVEARQQAGIDRALAENEVALVHMHGLDFDRYRIPANVPVLVTLHLPPAWYPQSIWALPDQYTLVCVSESQRRACPPEVQARVGVVENGVPLPDAKTLRPEGRYALMLARICAEKNLHVGLDAGQLAGLPVLLGGDVFPYEAHQQYFREQVEPRLTGSGTEHEDRTNASTEGPRARFLGPVVGEEKRRVLGRAACLLLPSLAPETSSLVAMEALAAGVPVIGMAVGAVPEIVEHGRTGYLLEPGSDTAERMAQAIRRLPEIDRRVCRQVAESRFPAERMVTAYAALYQRLAVPGTARRPGADAAPESRGEFAAAADTAPRTLVAAELTDAGELEALAEEWRELWMADRQASPFQHPAWLLPWWDQFGPDGVLRSVTLRDEAGRLAGLLPLYTYLPAGSAERQLLFLGAGTSDYLDGVWAPWAKTAAACGLAYLRSSMGGWDVASLQQLRPGSALCAAAAEQDLPLKSAEPCSALTVAEGPPAKVRRNLNRYRRMAERRGSVHCDLLESETDVLEGFEVLVRLHGERWRERGEPGVLHDPRVLAHHRACLPKLLQAGLVRMFRLTVAGRIVGVLYGFADGPHVEERRIYLYLVGFDKRVADVSPGSLLLQKAWEYAGENGFFKLDLLRGGESYKHLWGALTEDTVSLAFLPEQKQGDAV